MTLFYFVVLVLFWVIVSRSWPFYVEWKRKRDAEVEAELARLMEWGKTAKPGSLYATNYTQILRHAYDRELAFSLGLRGTGKH